MSYEADIKRWDTVLKVFIFFFYAMILLNVVLIAVSLFKIQFIAALIFLLGLAFNLLLLKNSKHAYNEKSLQILYAPYRVVIYMLGAIY